jgi:acyl-CoA thioester hydrolase
MSGGGQAPDSKGGSAPRSISRVRVRYAETDQMAVVYHANYFVWFEIGRTDLLRHSGWSYRELEAEGVSLPVIEAHCKYHQPARYDDDLDVHARARLLSPVRIEFTYDLVRSSDGTALATGRTVHVGLDRDGRPCRLPARVRAIFDRPDEAPV